MNDEDITIEVLLPTLDMPNVAVHIAPRQFLLSSDIDEEGFQICQVIDLPCDISMAGVDAEQNRDPHYRRPGLIPKMRDQGFSLGPSFSTIIVG